MSEPKPVYHCETLEAPEGPVGRLLREMSQPEEPLRLLEPDLSYYRVIRAQYDAAQIQAATLSQALGALNPVLARRYGLGPEDAIDAEGFIHRRPAEAP
jgi:hypothetical protein